MMQRMSAGSQNRSSSTGRRDPAAEVGGGDSNFIAGVFIPAKNERLSVYEAMVRGLLSPGTALVLLEAQAASGLLTDPQRNEQLSVEEALARGLIGYDFYEKLLSAEGAVTGYTHPYTGQKMSLFQAMKQELILRDHAIRLLQAQIATGGIIDPGSGRRVSVEAARERGFLDQEMSRVLSDPQNQSRTCFDPNTHENLSYLQLLRRCVPDPETGLLMLQLMDKGSVLYQLSEDARRALQAARTTLPLGLFQGQSVTLWELLFSRYVPEPRRQQLLRQYKAGTVSIAEMSELLTAMVSRAEAQGPKPTEREGLAGPIENGSASKSQKGEQEQEQEKEQELEQEKELDQELERSLKSHTVEVVAGGSHGRKVSLWELLFSHDIPEQQREELLRRYKAGSVTILEMGDILTATVAGAGRDRGALGSATARPHTQGRASPPAPDTPQAQEQQLRRSLKSVTVHVTAGEFRGQKVSVLDLLFSKYVPQGTRQELLELYRAGILSTEQVGTVVTTLVSRAEAANARSPHRAGAGEGEGDGAAALDDALRATTIAVPAGELQGRQVSLWDLICSEYIPEEKRQELLELYHERLLTLEQMATVVSTLVRKKESTGRKFHISVKTSPVTGSGEESAEPPKEEQWETPLKSTVVHIEAGEFQGHGVSLWELLHSRYIPQENRRELLELFRAGELSLEQVRSVVTTIVSRAAAAERAQPGTPVGGDRVEPGTPVGGDETEPGTPVGGDRAQPGTPVGGDGAEPGTPVGGDRAEPGTPVGGDRAQPGVTEAEPSPLHGDGAWAEPLKATRVEVPMGDFQGRQVSLWDLICSQYIPEEKRQELLQLYHERLLTLEQMATVVSTLVRKKESTGRKFHISVKASPVTGSGEEGAEPPKEEQWETPLKSTVVHIEAGEFRGHGVSLWELLHSRYIPRENRRELLELFRAGELSLEQVRSVVTTIVSRTAAAERAEPGAPVGGDRGELGTRLGGDRAQPGVTEAEPSPLHGDGGWEEPLKATKAEVPAGELQGRQVSLWDLIFSQHVPEEKRQELLELYREGTLPIQELLGTTSDSLEEHLRALPARTMELLRSEGSDITFAPGQRRRVSVWELLSSRRVSEYKREACLDTYPSGGLTVNRITVTTSVTTGPRESHPRYGDSHPRYRESHL